MSKIEWTDATWNPVVGCEVLSAGCTNCYAMAMANRLAGMKATKSLYGDTVKKVNGKAVWSGVVKENQAVLNKPYRWRKPRKIFVNSMSDLFHEDVSTHFIQQVWRVMKETPQHTYQILTKRPERMRDILLGFIDEVLPNVWLGTSVENHKVSHRIDALRQVPAAVRFISFEPLIGAVGQIDLSDIHWAIIGGESGPNARPCKVFWISALRRSCRIGGVRVFVKQLGANYIGYENQPVKLKCKKGAKMSEWPASLRVQDTPRVRSNSVLMPSVGFKE